MLFTPGSAKDVELVIRDLQKLQSKLLVSHLIAPMVVSYEIPHITRPENIPYSPLSGV